MNSKTTPGRKTEKICKIFCILSLILMVAAGVWDVLKDTNVFDYVYFVMTVIFSVYILVRIVREKRKRWYHALLILATILANVQAVLSAFYPQILKGNNGLDYAIYAILFLSAFYYDRLERV